MISWTLLGIGIVFELVIGMIVLYIAAKIVKIEDATIVKAFITALIVAILGAAVGLISPWTAGLLGTIIVWILVLPVIKVVYATTWLKAFITWIIYIIGAFIIGFIIGIALAGIL
ncbi:MAG: hypothetical protein AYK19_02400 [Theionarchaea archaeon DG-70-1]|nr:MAG: hypothetical protein AYK19_02400 [Theionarchaea archaeon DG-70-1]